MKILTYDSRWTNRIRYNEFSNVVEVDGVEIIDEGGLVGEHRVRGVLVPLQRLEPHDAVDEPLHLLHGVAPSQSS